jgi:hypothetical protein
MDTTQYKEHLISLLKDQVDKESAEAFPFHPTQTLEQILLARTQNQNPGILACASRKTKPLQDLRASNEVFTTNYFKSDLSQTSSTYQDQFRDKTEEAKACNSDIKDAPFNFQKTQIAEYSNALHNNRVFTNPRYLSC